MFPPSLSLPLKLELCLSEDARKHLSEPIRARGLWVTIGRRGPQTSRHTCLPNLDHTRHGPCGSGELVGWFNIPSGSFLCFSASYCYKLQSSSRADHGVINHSWRFNPFSLCCKCDADSLRTRNSAKV